MAWRFHPPPPVAGLGLGEAELLLLLLFWDPQPPPPWWMRNGTFCFFNAPVLLGLRSGPMMTPLRSGQTHSDGAYHAVRHKLLPRKT